MGGRALEVDRVARLQHVRVVAEAYAHPPFEDIDELLPLVDREVLLLYGYRFQRDDKRFHSPILEPESEGLIGVAVAHALPGRHPGDYFPFSTANEHETPIGDLIEMNLVVLAACSLTI